MHGVAHNTTAPWYAQRAYSSGGAIAAAHVSLHVSSRHTIIKCRARCCSGRRLFFQYSSMQPSTCTALTLSSLISAVCADMLQSVAVNVWWGRYHHLQMEVARTYYGDLVAHAEYAVAVA